MRPASTVTPSGEPRELCLERFDRHGNAHPGEPRLPQFADHARAPLFLVAVRGPPPHPLELPQEVRPAQNAGRAGELPPETSASVGPPAPARRRRAAQGPAASEDPGRAVRAAGRRPERRGATGAAPASGRPRPCQPRWCQPVEAIRDAPHLFYVTRRSSRMARSKRPRGGATFA